VFLVVALLLFLFYSQLLRLFTQLVTIQEDLPSRVDAVLVFEGDDRHAMAARWVNSGYAGQALLQRRSPERNVLMGVLPPRDFLDRKKLLELDVNETSIQCLDDDRSRGEWRHLRLLDKWLREHPEAKVVILCERFDSRWTRFAVSRVLSPQDAKRVFVHGLASLAYDERTWWRSRRGAVQLFESCLEQAYVRWAGEDPDEPVTWDLDAFERGLVAR